MFPQRSRDDGFTMVEVLVALTILTASVAATVTGLAMSAQSSDRHRRQTQDEVLVRTWAEAVAGATYQANCVTAVTSYSATTLGLTVPSGYTALAPTVVALSGTCGTSLEKVTVTVRSTDLRATTSLDLVKYKP